MHTPRQLPRRLATALLLAAALALPGGTSAGADEVPRITGFELRDVEEDRVLRTFPVGADVRLEASLLPEELTVVALAEHTGSVELDLDRGRTSRVEDHEPYALAGDGVAAALDQRNRITATPYARDGRRGARGASGTLVLRLVRADHVVDTHQDLHDADPGDGVCATDGSGSCSLRAAIEEANASPGLQHVALPGGQRTYVLESGQLGVTDDLRITGQGRATVSGDHRSRVLDVRSALLVMSDVRVRAGDAGIGRGGGIRGINDAVLLLVDVEVTRSRANIGGGIHVADSYLVLHRGRLTENTAGDPDRFGGGGITQRGGGLAVVGDGEAAVTQSTIAYNRAVRGGGIAAFGTTRLANTTVIDNEAVALGGGIEAQTGATLVVAGSTVARNRAGTSARAPESHRVAGGIYVNGRVAISNSIIAENVSGADGRPDDCDGGTGPGSELVAWGGNVVGAVGGTCSIDDRGRLLAGTPRRPLDPGFDGFVGPTTGFWRETLALRADSVAVDLGGDLRGSYWLRCREVDQLGADRPVGRACDAGAWEHPAPR